MRWATGPCTFFVCGRTLLHALDAIEPLADSPLFDIQQHTYSHVVFRDVHYQPTGGEGEAVLPETPHVAIREELRITSELIEKHLKPEHVREAQAFYEEHGGLAIVACRFLPIVRTLVPFVAGVTRMEFHRYLFFAALAAVIWVTVFLGAGYLFGNVSWVRDYLAVALAVAVAASAIPGFVIWAVHYLRRQRSRQAG